MIRSGVVALNSSFHFDEEISAGAVEMDDGLDALQQFFGLQGSHIHGVIVGQIGLATAHYLIVDLKGKLRDLDG